MPAQTIRVFQPSFPPTGAIAAYLDEAASTGQYSNGGPLVTRLEARFAEHFGVPAAQVAVSSSGTSALEAAIAVVEPDAQWDTPAWTFTATPGSVLRAGRTAHFVDVDEDQRAMLGPSSAPGIDVLPFGSAPRPERWAGRDTVLVDAAASFDACRSFPLGSAGRVGVMVSLHATKSLPAGEGGVFFSNDPQWVADFRRWGNFGMWGSRISQVPGTNTKLSEITASVAHASIDEWPDKRARWIELGDHAGALSAALGIGGRLDTAGVATPYWIVEFPDTATRVAVEEHLAAHGVETRRWWGDGCHRMPAYQHISSYPLPNTDDIAGRVLGLPFHLGLTTADLDRVGALTSDVLDARR